MTSSGSGSSSVENTSSRRFKTFARKSRIAPVATHGCDKSTHTNRTRSGSMVKTVPGLPRPCVFSVPSSYSSPSLIISELISERAARDRPVAFPSEARDIRFSGNNMSNISRLLLVLASVGSVFCGFWATVIHYLSTKEIDTVRYG